MKVSVLIPAYRAGRFLATALAAVKHQTHHDWELAVVEDGSQDETEELVRDFARSVPQRVTFQRAERNGGVSATRNLLVAAATGDAVAFLDADDRWSPGHLADAVRELEHGADVVVSGVNTFDLESGRPLAGFPAPAALRRDAVRALFARSLIVTSSAVVLRRELMRSVGAFDAGLRIGEDRDYWLRCALAGARFATTSAATCAYAKHDASSMARTQLVAEQCVCFYEKYARLAAVPARLRRRLLAASLIDLGRLLRRRDHARSAACFRRAWRLAPFNPRIPLHLAFTGWRARAVQAGL